MKLVTKSFGEIEVSEDKIIAFEEGMPGFEELHRFIFINSEDEVFNYLQSADDAEVRFIIVDPYKLLPDYAPSIKESYFEKLGGGRDEDFAIYAVACLRETVEDSTINLAGPILIQTEYKRGIQVITEDKKYSARHRLLDLVNGGK